MRWSLFVLIAVGCSKGASPHASASSGSGSAAPAVVVVAADAVAPADAELLGDLPAFTIDLPADRTAIDAAEKLNTAGYGFHVKKDFSSAISKYREALGKDPGSLLARYNLASAYHSSGDDTRALALLAQFKQPHCRACTAILSHAKTDNEWKALFDNAEFKSITADAGPDTVDIVKLTAKVSAALATKKLDDIAPYIHPHAAMKERELSYGPDATDWTSHYGRAGFQEFVDGLRKSYVDEGNRPHERCAKQGGMTCCRGGARGDMPYSMASVCFSTIGGVPFIAQIELDPGSA